MCILQKKYILYNPEAGNGNCSEDAKMLDIVFPDTVYLDITKIGSYREFFQTLNPSDEVILCGGDGTLNRFVNDTRDVKYTNSIYYFPAGNGNDFARDLGLSSDELLEYPMNDYLRDLPQVTVNEKTCYFLNNVGFGIDGYCSEEGERVQSTYNKGKKTEKKKVNYTLLAIKGLLMHFRPRKAIVTVDGSTHSFEKVWLASALNGRFYGGGMMAAPEQNRLDPEKSLSLLVIHTSSRLKTLCIFPSIFSGKHIRHKKYITLLTGHEISVAFDRPTPLQIDGETTPNVLSYQVISAKKRLFEREAAYERAKG